MQDQIYLKPTNLNAALDYLTEFPEATLWAGGTDLVVKLEHKRIKVSAIIDLTRVPELNYIEETDAGTVKIGALSNINAIEYSPLVRKEFPLLAQAAHFLGSWQIRTLATIGGNLVTAAPSAETAAPLLVLGATMVARSKQEERRIPAHLFFKGPGQTALLPGEILKEIEIPKLPQGSKSIYLKESLRRSMDIALASMGCVLKLDGDQCREVRIGLGAVAPVPMRADETEALLNGHIMTDEIIGKAALKAAEECKPIDDIRATAVYRRELVQTMVQKALISLWKDGEEQ
ncbi:FAD binding domain-containing protein [Syntrophomonas curvata]